MKRTILMLSLALAGCGSGPVDTHAVGPPDNAAGDQSSSGLATPANAAAAEARIESATPPSTDGQVWRDSSDATHQQMSYGPLGGVPALVLSCASPRQGSTLTVVRGTAAPRGGVATMSFTGGGHVASLTMHATASGNGEALWSGVAELDDARSIAKTFSTPAPVMIGVSDAAGLVVPAAPVVRELFDRCVG